MAARLVLAWELSHHALLEYVTSTPGPIRVVSDDDELVEGLRAESIPVIHDDPTSRAVLADLDSFADVVLIAARDPERNAAIATVIREIYPHAEIISFAGIDASSSQLSRLESIVDCILEHAPVLSDAVLERSTSPAAVRAHRVRSILEALDEELFVFMHDNPDPDAIASAVALVRVANTFDVSATACYHGEISHQSNRAFVNLLDLSIESLDPEEDPPEGAIALVDHAIPGINDSLPPGTPVTFIFDHHTPAGPVEAQYVDLRESIGATSSILIEYLRQFEIEIDDTLASALLYGIRTDTKDFSRKVTPLDFESAGFVWPRANHDELERIASPGITHETITTIAEAIAAREVRGPVLSTCVGEIGERDAIAQSADLLLQMDSTEVVLVYGFRDGIAYASARSRGGTYPLDLSAVLRDAFGQIGTAGGHEEMAGAQLPLGVLAAEGMGEHGEAEGNIREVIDERFFEAVADRLTIDIPRVEALADDRGWDGDGESF